MVPGQLGARRDRAADFPFEYGTPWGYKFLLDVGPLSRINELYFHGKIREWNEFMEHGTYDEYWQKQTLVPHLKNIEHAVLSVTGWFDSEDFYGPISIYNKIEKETPDNQSTLVVGPWSHGAWGEQDGDRFGEMDFGSKTSFYFREQIEYPFFSHYLKDKGISPKPLSSRQAATAGIRTTNGRRRMLSRKSCISGRTASFLSTPRKKQIGLLTTPT